MDLSNIVTSFMNTNVRYVGIWKGTLVINCCFIQVCVHAGPNIDPELRDTPTDTWDVEGLKKVVKDFFPGAQPTPSVQETCIYTVSRVLLSTLTFYKIYHNIDDSRPSGDILTKVPLLSQF